MLFSGRLTKVQQVAYELDAVKTNTLVPVEKEILTENNIASAENGVKVFNFEVEGWHTYFVGFWKFLVHNATCIYTLAKEGVEWAKNIVRGLEFNKLINKEMFDLAKLKNLKYESEVWLKDGAGKLVKRLDGLIPGKAIIERKATKLGEVSEETAKSYIRQAADHKGLEVANAARNEGSIVLKGTEESILQVQSKEGISDAVKQYAIDKKVTIVESSEEIFKLIGF